MTFSVAVTGNVGAGKSEIVRLWQALGVPVLGADDLARRAVEPGTPALREIRERFGDEVIAADGTLDRARLRSRVFRNHEARARLEAIVHPRIRALRDVWLEQRRNEGEALVVSEIPLLFETGLESEFDATVLVDAPETVRLSRLTTGRGLEEEEARRIMASQMPAAQKRARAGWVVDNEGSLDDLARRALEVLAELRRGAGIDPTQRLDLHLHTAASWDCLSDPDRVVERARALGIERIAVTDHDRLDVALALHGRYGDAVIPGEEVRTAEGIDVIGLYLHEEIPRGTPAREVVTRVREQGGVSVLPHPYATGKGGRGRYAEELAALVDVIEVFNARLHPGRLNASAEELARRHGRLRSAGSDAHMLREVGGGAVEVPRHVNRPDALRVALRGAQVHGRTASNLVHLASTWAKVAKRIGLGRSL